jgi:hypothetical protein
VGSDVIEAGCQLMATSLHLAAVLTLAVNRQSEIPGNFLIERLKVKNLKAPDGIRRTRIRLPE